MSFSMAFHFFLLSRARCIRPGALVHLAYGSTGIVEGPLATACASKDYNPTRHSFPFDIALS
jgi:hypothetical protein